MSSLAPEQDFLHLAPSVRPLAALPGSERCRFIQQSRWIGYGRAKQALAELERLLEYPRRDRMPNMLLVGPTNNGKSKIIRKFSDRHPPSRSGDVRVTPVVLVEMPPQPGLARLYGALLEAIGVPFRRTSRIEVLEPLALTMLREVGTKMIIIDEVHNLLACNALQQRQVLNQLKYLGNQLRIPLVGVGTEEAWSAIKSDPQMANRFEQFALPLWSEGDELTQLLMTFGQSLPLRHPSDLANDRIAKLVLSQTDGSIGGITRLIEAAAIRAIDNGSERMTHADLTPRA